MSDDLTLLTGDCIQVLKTLPDNSIDAVCTDPPYGLEFMGKDWDAPWKAADALAAARMNAGAVIHDPAAERGGFSRSRIEYGRGGAASTGFQDWCLLWAVECLRVLKPGAHMLAFGGTRTWHRLACAVEDAGFEIRDSIAWLYGSGFPKSMDVAKAIDKADGIWRGRAGAAVPDDRRTSFGQHYERTPKGDPATAAAAAWAGWGTALKPAFEPIVVARKPFPGSVAGNVQAHGTGALNIDGCRVGTDERINQPGSTRPRVAMGDGWREDAQPTTAVGRWPANVILDDTQAAELDTQSGTLTSGANPTRRGADTSRTAYGDFTGQEGCAAPRGIDSGGASRFFPTFRYTPKAPRSERPSADGTAHPTVKPVELMAWLIRLVTPPLGLVLDPFAGSGTTLEAALREGKRAIGIERDPSYIALIHDRLSRTQHGFDFGGNE